MLFSLLGNRLVTLSSLLIIVSNNLVKIVALDKVYAIVYAFKFRCNSLASCLANFFIHFFMHTYRCIMINDHLINGQLHLIGWTTSQAYAKALTVWQVHVSPFDIQNIYIATLCGGRYISSF